MFRGYKPVKARNTGKRHQPIVAQPSSMRGEFNTRLRMMFNTFRSQFVFTENAFHDLLCVPPSRVSSLCVANEFRHIYIASTIPLCSNELVKSRGGIIEHIRYPPIFVRVIILFRDDGSIFMCRGIIENYTILVLSIYSFFQN